MPEPILEVRDLESKNGVYVNERRVSAATLALVWLGPHQPPIPLVSDETTCAAPKISATPITTEKAHIQGIRLVRARYPTAATATVAAVVAKVPVMKDRTSVMAVFRG